MRRCLQNGRKVCVQLALRQSPSAGCLADTTRIVIHNRQSVNIRSCRKQRDLDRC